MEDGQGLELFTRLFLAMFTVLVTVGLPFVSKLFMEWLKSGTNEKTLIVLSELVQTAIEVVEEIYNPDGDEDSSEVKKKMAMDMVKVSAGILGIKISEADIEKLIDMLLEAAVSRTFNTPLPELVLPEFPQ